MVWGMVLTGMSAVVAVVDDEPYHVKMIQDKGIGCLPVLGRISCFGTGG